MFPNEKKINKLFFYWLSISLILVFFIIIVGGLTRLTNSGLSITQWELFKGILPPLNENSWQVYFKKYKEIPQYKLLNFNMSLDEFKIIFYWEYFHRVLARIIGLFFLIPLIYFYLSKKISSLHLQICFLILFLIIFQGFIGWYMVMSGLVNDVTVSHYRLSIHLFTAFLIISIIFWLIKNILTKKNKKFFKFTYDNFPFQFLILIVYLQIIIGAFVSGLDAGKIYQTWPLMGSSYIPDDLIVNNFINYFDFDNHSLVQFYHRNLAYIISAYIVFLFLRVFIFKNYHLYKPVLILFIILFLQIFLGILTLKSDLHIMIASAHQISSVILVLSSINLYYSAIK